MRPKRDYDREIDAALAMMNDVQSPVDLNVRVHRHLAAYSAPQTSREVRFLGIPLAGAAMAVILLTVFITMREARYQRGSFAPIQTAVSSPITRATLPRPAQSNQELPTIQIVPTHIAPHKYRQRTHRARLRNSPFMSYPLTRQERLLIQFAHTASLKDLQMLNPAYQAKLEAQQEAAFTAYIESDNRDNENATTAATAAKSSQSSSEE